MPYLHLAHLDSFEKHVKVGVKIKRGDPIGKVGKTGTQYAHCHFEVLRVKPDYWTQYVYDRMGRPLSEAQFDARYINPDKWIDRAAKIPAAFTTYGGFGFKDKINRLGALHGGVDINDGYGDQDLGNPVRSPATGEIVYVGRNDGGWGNHLFIYEDDSNQFPTVDMNFAMQQVGRIFLAVEARGEAWYIDPEGKRHFMGSTPEQMLEFVKKQAVGITNADLNKIPPASSSEPDV